MGDVVVRDSVNIRAKAHLPGFWATARCGTRVRNPEIVAMRSTAEEDRCQRCLALAAREEKR